MKATRISQLTVAAAALSLVASAQNISKFVISDEAAKKTLFENETENRQVEDHAGLRRFAETTSTVIVFI